jgi:hypothetical protein
VSTLLRIGCFEKLAQLFVNKLKWLCFSLLLYSPINRSSRSSVVAMAKLYIFRIYATPSNVVLVRYADDTVAVEKAEDVPGSVEAATVEIMRKEYAEAHLESLVSLTQEYDKKNVWPQLLGVAYIRKIYSFSIATTEEQDDLLIGEYNKRENHSHFNLFTK